MTATLPEQLQQKLSDPALLGRELTHLITRRIARHPRSLQTALGPSEIGHDCARRIGYKLLDIDENPGQPNWKATVGTALHTWLEDMLTDDNRSTGEQRWIVEETVTVGTIAGQPIHGHCDVYDQVTGTVVDWKTCGPTQLTKYRSKGPGQQYRAQAQLYGRGWAARGMRVERVAVMFLPRNGELREAHYWSEPYDEQVALAALQRAEGIHHAVQALGDKALAVLPTADAFCQLCPYFAAKSTDLAEVGCPGDPNARPNSPRPAHDPNAPAFGAL